MAHKDNGFKYIKVSTKSLKSSIFHDTQQKQRNQTEARETQGNTLSAWMVKHWTRLPGRSQNLHHWTFLIKS